jgi:carnitine-CoA ligase
VSVSQHTERVGLLRGKGYDLGRHARAYPRPERSLVRVLADRAVDRADHTWLAFDGGRSLTFARAHALANRVGHAVAASVGRGAHVALFLRNQVEFMPSFLGPMAAGGVTVPLNADARGPLLEYVIAKSEARLLIARDDLLDRLDALGSLGLLALIVRVGGSGSGPERLHGVPVVAFDDWVAGRPDDPPGPPPGHDDVALIQFTSGTTGRSKGAIYPHHFLYLYSAMVSDSLEREPEDVLMTPLPLYHVAALHIVANSALHAGCTAHLPSRFSASGFWSEAATCGATFSIILGPMAAIILKTVPDAPRHRMETMFCVPPPPGREEFEARFGVRMLWQGYGMTEVYPLPMRREPLEGVPPTAIGHPVTWMEYGVVDEHDELLGPDEVGELVFRPLLPHAMVSGYHGDPEATALAFRNLMFHTGDLATYDGEGVLHYRGRMQERIRRRGENVSAFELETVALMHDQVVECAAYGVPGEFGEHDVKLDCVIRGDLAQADLHAWLVGNLPRYMVPRYVEFRDAFPKTPSERIEKYRLAAEPVDRPGVFDAAGP